MLEKSIIIDTYYIYHLSNMSTELLHNIKYVTCSINMWILLDDLKLPYYQSRRSDTRPFHVNCSSTRCTSQVIAEGPYIIVSYCNGDEVVLNDFIGKFCIFDKNFQTDFLQCLKNHPNF